MVEVLPNVSIVVIGHNEAKNLKSSFQAINSMNYPQNLLEIIYVDSNSTDNSIEIAKKYADKICVKNSKWPTAGEAFNAGIVNANSDFIHITAGDINLHPEYLKKAVKTLINNDCIDCVTGFFIEKEMKGWNKIISYRREEDKDKSPHFVDTPNGGTFKKHALYVVNGYDERIKKGQETELGKRFKDAGLKIWYLHIPQGMHDFDLNTFIDIVRRNFQNGYSLGYTFLLSLYEKENMNLLSFRRSAIRNLTLNGFFVSIFLLSIFFKLEYSLIWLLAYLCYFPLNAKIRHREKTWRHQIYYIFSGYFSIYSFIGIVSYIVHYMKNRLFGIELLNQHKGLTTQ